MLRKRPAESALMHPVLRLFPKARYNRFPEVSLGRKKIDLLCVSKAPGENDVSIELKVSEWRRALWQAIANFQIAEQSYIAIWEDYLARVEKEFDLLGAYGVGLISVGPRSATILRFSQDQVHRIARVHKREFYRHLTGQI